MSGEDSEGKMRRYQVSYMLDRMEDIYSEDLEVKYYVQMATEHMNEGQLDFALEIIQNIMMMCDASDFEKQRVQKEIIQNTKNIAIRFYFKEEIEFAGW